MREELVLAIPQGVSSFCPVSTHMSDKSPAPQRNPITAFLELELDSEIEIGDYSEFEGSGIMSDSAGKALHLLNLMTWKINLSLTLFLTINHLKIISIWWKNYYTHDVIITVQYSKLVYTCMTVIYTGLLGTGIYTSLSIARYTQYFYFHLILNTLYLQCNTSIEFKRCTKKKFVPTCITD